MRVPTAPLPPWPVWLRTAATGLLWWLAAPVPAHHSERHARFLLPPPVSEKRAVLPMPWSQEHLHVLASSVFSIMRSQMQLPFSEIPYRSRMGITSAASQEISRKANFKAMFFFFDLAHPLLRLWVKQLNLLFLLQ